MKKSFLIILLLLTLTLVGCSKESDFIDDFPAFSETKHVFEKVDYQEMIKALTDSNGRHIIIFSFKECPYCNAALPILNDAAIEANVDKILYYDIKKVRDENTAEYLLLLGYLESKVDDLLPGKNNEKKITVPDVYVIENSTVTSHHIATVKDEEGKFIIDMTASEKQTLKNIYLDMFK
jgi:glutaredoxin